MNFFVNSLGNWGPLLQTIGWATVLTIPPCILLLYFLKLRRQPLAVPSTYLWSRTIEDLHVNSIWQKLRQNILLFLQLFLAALIIVSLLRPGINTTELEEDRVIMLIDTSASMAATRDGKSRLDLAKENAKAIIDSLKASDVAMIISFSDRAKIEQSFTNNVSQLKRKLANIEQTQRTTNLDEALRAASGLANPGRIATEDGQDIQVADALPAQLFILSDGGVPKVPDFAMGNLRPTFLPVGDDLPPENVGIVSFSVETNVEKETQRQAFARLENSSKLEMAVDVDLYLNDKLIDSDSGVVVPPEDGTSIEFDIQFVNDLAGVLKLEITSKDDLDYDNRAYTVFNPPTKAKVLFVSDYGSNIQRALETTEIGKIAIVDVEQSAYLTGEDYKKLSESGYYDLVIYDQCVPEKMPECNTMFWGVAPPSEEWSLEARGINPLVTDVNRAHPLMRFAEIQKIIIADASIVKGPKGSQPLVDVTFSGTARGSGPMVVIGPRQGYEDLVMGFSIVVSTDDGLEQNTDWVRNITFPLFIQNVVEYLGQGAAVRAQASTLPGMPVQIRTAIPVETVDIQSPENRQIQVKKSIDGSFVFNQTDELGIYSVKEGSAKEVRQRFAVNLFDTRESDLRVPDKMEIGYEELEGQAGFRSSRYEYWKWLLVIGLVVLMAEWYIYNRRVYL